MFIYFFLLLLSSCSLIQPPQKPLTVEEKTILNNYNYCKKYKNIKKQRSCMQNGQKYDVIKKYNFCRDYFDKNKNGSFEKGMECSFYADKFIKKHPSCKTELVIFGWSGAKRCIHKIEEEKNKELKRQAYLKTPEGIKETKQKKEALKKAISTCEIYAREAETRYNLGRFQYIITAEPENNGFYSCGVQFVKPNINGYNRRILVSILINSINNTYQIRII